MGGVGGMLTFIATARFSWTSAHTSCYVPLGGVGGWGGGWGGGDVNVHCDCKEGWVGGWVGWGDVNVHCNKEQVEKSC